MQMKNLLGKIMGFIVIIVTLALAPTIQTANTTIEGLNLTNLTGMTAVSAFGAPLIILGLLVSGGIFALAGVRGRMQGASIGDMLGVIGSVVVIIVSLSLFSSVVTYCNALIMPGGVTGFGDVIYGIIPLVIYVGVIAAAGYVQVKAYRRLRRGGSRAAAGY